MHGQPVEQDPLQFGSSQAPAAEELPTAYGDPPAGQDAAASAPPAPPAAPQHDPLLAATAVDHAPQQASAYPRAPVAADYGSVSLGSATSSQGGSAEATPTAAAVAAAAGGALTGPHLLVDGGQPLTPCHMAASNPELQVKVLNPLRHMGASAVIPGVSEAYISYEVVTQTSLPHFGGSRFSVRRRFRDFVSLSNLLPKLLHGSFLPARPEKNLIESRRMTDAFVEARRAALERYLNRLAAHAAAARSEVLRVFLEADGALRAHPQWRALKPGQLTPTQATSRLIRSLVGVRKTAPTPSEVVQPAAACRDVYRLLHESIQQMRGSFKHAPLSAQELALRNDTLVVEDAAGALHVALHRAEALAKACAGRAALLSEAAVAMQALATFETSYAYAQQQTRDAVAAVARACHAAGGVATGAAATASAALQPLRDHHAITPNVLGALHARERQLLTAMTLRQDLEDRRAALAAAQLTPASQAKRVDTLRSQVSQLEVSAAAAEAEYTRQLERNQEELAALRVARGSELCAMLSELVRTELAHERQEAAVWQQLVAKLPPPGQTTAYMAQRDLAMGPVS